MESQRRAAVVPVVSPLFAPRETAECVSAAVHSAHEVPPLFSLSSALPLVEAANGEFDGMSGSEEFRLPLNEWIASLPVGSAADIFNHLGSQSSPPRESPESLDTDSSSSTSCGRLGVGDGEVAGSQRWGSSELSHPVNSSPTSPTRGPIGPARAHVHSFGVQKKSATGPIALPAEVHQVIGANLNFPPPNWKPSENQNWNPVSSAFSMVDMIASLLEDCRADRDGTDPTSTLERPPDIVCPADQLKRILMAQVNGSPLAFVAHRIGPSLVIEGSPKPPPNTVREARNEALKSKLLHFSILAAEEGSGAAQSSDFVEEPRDKTSITSNENSSVPFSSTFRKTLHWSFGDLSVMLGVDSPTVTAPPLHSDELTLQFVDVRGRPRHQTTHAPLLTKEEALDVWLDAIMANVDGVALCYHADGVVQGCQVVSTSTIPQLTAEQFEPVAIQREARHVLQWLRSSCACTGGSYVVLKERNGGALRLFDISDFGRASSESSSGREAQAAIEQTKTPSVALQSLSAIDDDADVGCKHFPSQSHQRQQLRTFTFPVAMMCLRMAQALPNSDAEALRLLLKAISLMEELESFSFSGSPQSMLSGQLQQLPLHFPLAKAHALCMRHFHSSSPLTDAEHSCLWHAKKVVGYCERLRESFTFHCQAENSSNAIRLAQEEEEVDSIIAEVVRSMAALAHQKIRSKKYVEALEAIGLCQFATYLRRHAFPGSIQVHETAEDELLREFICDSSISRRGDEIVAALLQLETLTGDLLCQLDSISTESTGLLEKLNVDAQIALARTNHGFKVGSRWDFLSALLPVPLDSDERMRRATLAFQTAVEIAEQIPTNTRDLHRKLASIAVQRAERLSTSPTPNALEQARDLFCQASKNFLAVDDRVNWLMMSLNVSKTSLRLGQTRDETEAAEAMHDFMTAVRFVEECLTVEEANSLHDRSVLSLAHQHMVNVYLMYFHAIVGTNPVGKPAVFDSSMASSILDRLVRSLQSCVAVSPWVEIEDIDEAVVSEKPLSQVETAIHDLILHPALRHSKKVTSPMQPKTELLILQLVYRFHLACGNVQSLDGQPAVAALSGAARCQHALDSHRINSVRCSIARARQFLAKLATTTPDSIGISWQAHRREVIVATSELLTGYTFLIQHCSHLDEGEAKDAEVDVIERAATSLCELVPVFEECANKYLVRDHDMGFERSLSLVASTAAFLAMRLLRLMNMNTEKKASADALRDIAKLGTMLAVRTTPATFTELCGLTGKLRSVFDGRRKKQTSKFF